MNVIRNKILHSCAKNNFLDKRLKIFYSSTLDIQKIAENQISNKVKKQSLGWHEKNKILDSLLSSEILPDINKNTISLLRSYITFKRNINIKYSFVVDSEVAKDIVDKILLELKQERSFVVEANPGLGLMTIHLIKSGVPKICIYENSKLKNISLQQLLNKYPDQLQIEHHNIFLPKSNHLLSILDNALKLNINNKIIGVVQQSQFFTNLIQDCVNCSLWNSIQKTDFFLVVSKSIWKNVMQDTESRFRYLTYCFFNLIFETKLLAEYPSSAFLPYSPTFKEDQMYFVKISKRSNFPGELDEKDIKSLINFCNVLGRSKFNYIIPTLEEWIPECGPYLISKGISVSNQINDLSYDEFKKLYLFLKKIKGFQNFEIVN